MRRKYDLAVKVSEYQDSYNRTRARWKNVGALLEDDKGGQFIMLDKYVNYALLGQPDRDTILVSLFEIKDQRNSGSGSTRESQPQAGSASSYNTANSGAASEPFNSNLSVQSMQNPQMSFDIGQPMIDNPSGVPF